MRSAASAATGEGRRAQRSNQCPLLVVVEGIHDVSFLRGISRMLHQADSSVADLSAMESQGQLLFIPFGGSDPRPWVSRLAPLGLPEVHIYDREAPPHTRFRQQAVDAVNRRTGCRAFLTGPPTLECFLHPEAVWRALGVRITVEPGVDLVATVARTICDRMYGAGHWASLPARCRKRRRDQLKGALNSQAVACMTPELLAETDSDGEIRSWLVAMAELGGWRSG